VREKKSKEKLPGAWLTVAEVAGVMSVSQDSVARLIASGVLPAVLIQSGKRKKTYRIRPEAFSQWAVSRERSHKQTDGAPAMHRPKFRVPETGSIPLKSSLKSSETGDRAEKALEA